MLTSDGRGISLCTDCARRLNSAASINEKFIQIIVVRDQKILLIFVSNTIIDICICIRKSLVIIY